MSGFASDFSAHKGRKDSISLATCDMSPGFWKGIGSNFPDAQSVIDKFHVVKHPNEAPDSVRRREPKENGELKGMRFIWRFRAYGKADGPKEWPDEDAPADGKGPDDEGGAPGRLQGGGKLPGCQSEIRQADKLDDAFENGRGEKGCEDVQAAFQGDPELLPLQENKCDLGRHEQYNPEYKKKSRRIQKPRVLQTDDPSELRRAEHQNRQAGLSVSTHTKQRKAKNFKNNLMSN